ncbi:MAG TPA: hypothetical protein VHK88_08180 [Aquihabitans sp.]|jgi:hypothetical protein|nr:hypothetical protein [Aquihabitans sp.]
MTEPADLDLLATIASLAGQGESTDLAALQARLDEPDATPSQDPAELGARLGRLDAAGLIDVEGDPVPPVPPGDGSTPPPAHAAITVTPLGWATVVPDYPT